MHEVPCGQTMGHGLSCTEDYLCGSCAYIKELEAEAIKLRASNVQFELQQIELEARLVEAEEFAKICANTPVGQMIKQLERVRRLTRYRVEAVETWMNHTCPAFKESKHGDCVRADELQEALEEVSDG